jgi:hypothetical protein
MKPWGSPVLSCNGDTILTSNDPRLAGVVDIDVGEQDLQQCADFIIRLHAEYSWAYGERDNIYYTFTSGDTCWWSDWRKGYRPVVIGNWVKFVLLAVRGSSHDNFRKYLDKVFNYAGTASISRDYGNPESGNIKAGDFFVDPGRPGHAVVILDVCENNWGDQRYLLGQGFMPAQSFQILQTENGDVWFEPDSEGVKTPFWHKFKWSQLRRHNWFGLMAARTVQLYGSKTSGDTEVHVTYSYNFKSGEGF